MGERKRRMAAAQARAPGFDFTMIATAFRALEGGDRPAAEIAFDGVQATVPDDAEALNALGIIAVQLGRSARALELFGRAIALDTRNPGYRCNRAIAWRRSGRGDLAITDLEAALALDPALPEAHCNLGNVLLERGEHSGAASSFERALALRHDYPEALNGLGDASVAGGDAERALVLLQQAIALAPAFHEAHYNLSRAHAAQAAGVEVSAPATEALSAAAHATQALASIVAALEISADNADYWIQFERCVGLCDLAAPVDPRLRTLLLRALGHPAVEPARLARPIVRLATTFPGAAALAARLPSSGTFDARLWPDVEESVRAILGEPLLQRLLEESVVADAFVQRLVNFARGALLAEFLRDSSAAPPLPLPCIVAIAHQCFQTEYVSEEPTTEAEGLTRVAAAIAAPDPAARAAPPHAYAIYACYRPLHALARAEAIAAELAGTALGPLASRQIAEPLEEQRIRPTIEALTPVADEVSAAVQAQYEANPYPRWVRARRARAQPSLVAYLRARFPGTDLEALVDAPARILVAGCGTGRHSIATAQRHPQACVLAIDLSRTSLAYALRKTREQGVANVDYRQADLLALSSLGERFDVIECVGVLHHLRDPLAGWRVLCGLLAPGGAMRVGLYSEIARRHVVRGRALVAQAGFAPTPDGIRACRAAILAGRDDPLLARIARGEDFYSLTGCRDLLFHVQEHRYTLPQITRLLAELGLDFIGFEFPDGGTVAAYRATFPDDPALADLDRWHRFELARPDTFAQMYQFWVRRRGEPRSSAHRAAGDAPARDA